MKDLTEKYEFEIQTCSTRAASTPNINNEKMKDAHPPHIFLLTIE